MKKNILILLTVAAMMLLTACIKDSEGRIKALTITGITMENKQTSVAMDNPFSPEIKSYICEVEYNVEKIIINAEPFSGSEVTQTDLGTKNLTAGENNFTVKVKAVDGTAVTTYMFYIVRKKADSNSYLKAVTLSGITIEPVFNKTIKTYEAVVPFETTMTAISAEPESKKAKITDDSLGNKSLLVGDNKLTVTVVGEDGNVRSYTFLVKRQINEGLDGNSTLRVLTISTGTLDPAFAPSKNFYMASVPSDRDKITVTAAPYSSKAKIISGTSEQALVVGNNILNIIVEAENGTRTNYSILVNRAVNGSADTNSSLASLTCSGIEILPVFDKGTMLYQATVNNTVTSTSISAVAESSKAVLLSGELGEKVLKVGTNAFGITVTAENGSKKTYSVIINRLSDTSKETNADLAELNVSGVPLSPVFDKDITVYTANIPYDTTETQVTARASSTKAVIAEGSIGTKKLAIGLNQIQVKVTAESGAEKIYSVIIIRETLAGLNKNAQLKSITIAGISYNPKFDPNVTLYAAQVPNSTTSVSISAETMTTKAAIDQTGIGQKNLTVGINTFPITVTSEDGTKSVYTMIITRAQSSDATLSTLSVKVNNEEKIANFLPATYTYNIVVPFSITTAAVTYSKNSSAATVTGTEGAMELKVGLNIKSISVKSEDGTINNYTVLITRTQQFTNTYLASLALEGITISPEFEKNTMTYSANVDENTTSVKVSGEAEESTSVVTGTGIKALVVGTNVIEVKVTAQDGKERSYVIAVQKAASSDNKLKTLSVKDAGGNEKLTGFAIDTLSYTLNVTNAISKVTLAATPNADTSSVSGNTGELVLIEGENNFNIVVTAQNSKNKIYKVKVIRERKSNDAKLKSLTVEGVTIAPSFNPLTTLYNASVTNSVISLNILAEANSTLATESGIGIKNISEGSNSFEVKVTAEDGTEKKYTIVIMRAYPDSNAFLTSIKFDKGSLSPDFDMNKLVYTLNVPNSAETVELTPIPDSGTTVLSGGGVKNLSVGTNVVEILIQAQDGKKKSYLVAVNRTEDNDATLKTLSVKGSGAAEKLSGFRSDLTDYTINLDNAETEITISATASSINAKISGNLGKFAVNEGENNFSLVAAAQDGTTKIYNVKVIRALKDSDATLSLISSDKGVLMPVFDKNKTWYEIDVANSATEITLYAMATSSKAVVTGAGKKSLVEGNNNNEITVTAEDGSIQKYVVVVVRALKDSNTFLSDLTVEGYKISPQFDKNTVVYTMSVQYSVTKVNVGAVAEQTSSTVTGTGEKTLNKGPNVIEIKVTSENGKTQTYVLVVNRASTDGEAVLSTLSLSNGTISPAFNKDTKVYTATVPNEVDAVTINAEIDGTLQVTGNGLKQLTIGSNVFEITVTAQSGESRTYIVSIYREPSNDNNLKLLSVQNSDNYSELIESFDAAQNDYYITVPAKVSNVKIYASANSNTAGIAGDIGYQDLKEGENNYNVIVTAQSGKAKTYNVKIFRTRKSDDANLSSLNVAYGVTDSMTFDKDTTLYNLKALNSSTYAAIVAVANDSKSTVTGAGIKLLNEGTNIFEIKVTAENGTTKTYTIVISKAYPDSNAFLDSINIDKGNITPSFDKNTLVYNVIVENSVTELNLTPVADTNSTIVTGGGIKALNVGANICEILVRAQDGKLKSYVVAVTRQKDTDATLKTLSVKDNSANEYITATSNFETYNEITVSNNITTITIAAEKNSLKAVQTGNTGEFKLTEGKNLFNIFVSAEDGNVTIYDLVITREYKDNDSSLKELGVKSGSNNVPIMPDFTKEKLAYTVEVAYESDKVTLNSTASSIKASVVGNGEKNLTVGNNIFELEVTAEDLTKTKYNITIIRAKKEYNTYLSSLEIGGDYLSNGTISKSSLTYKVYKLTPYFSKNSPVYSISIPYTTSRISISAEAEQSTSTVSGAGEKSVAVGTTIYEIKVTSGEGKVGTYAVVVTRAASNTNLSTILTQNADYINGVQTYKCYSLSVVAEESNISDVSVYTDSAMLTGAMKATSGLGTKSIKFEKNVLINKTSSINALYMDVTFEGGGRVTKTIVLQ